MIGIIVFFQLSTFNFQLAMAQEVTQSIDLSIQSAPSDPAPGAQVTLEAISYSIDLTQATLSWTYGGKPVVSGSGRTRITVTAPQSGGTAIATVTASTTGISPVSATTTLSPGSIDLLWEALDSSVPPFYKGRPLLSATGIFSVVALPIGAAPRTANFQWSRNGSAVQGASGAGKSSITLNHDALNKDERIAVNVSGGGFQGEGDIAIAPLRPDIIVYQKKEGFTNYAIGSKGSVAISGSGTTLRAEPFFFSVPRSIAQDLSFDFQLGDAVVFGEDDPTEIRISRSEEPGAATFSAAITTTRYSLQNARRTFRLLFQ